MSDSDDSQEFNPQEIVKERESSDLTETVVKRIFSRVALSYLIAVIVGYFGFGLIGAIVVWSLSQTLSQTLYSSVVVLALLPFIGVIIGPLLWYSIRRYTDYEL